MKRSAQVLLAVMTAGAVGTTAYSLTPRNDCAPSSDAQSQSCGGPRGSGYYGFGSSSSGGGRQFGMGTAANAPGSAHYGGFGGSAHAAGAHGSGGS